MQRRLIDARYDAVDNDYYYLRDYATHCDAQSAWGIIDGWVDWLGLGWKGNGWKGNGCLFIILAYLFTVVYLITVDESIRCVSRINM